MKQSQKVQYIRNRAGEICEASGYIDGCCSYNRTHCCTTNISALSHIWVYNRTFEVAGVQHRFDIIEVLTKEKYPEYYL